MRAALRKGHGAATAVTKDVGAATAAAGNVHAPEKAAGKDVGGVTAAGAGKGHAAANDVGSARAAAGKGHAAESKAARPRPIRGPGLSGSRRYKQGSTQDGGAHPDSSGDASSDREESEFGSTALHGQGIGNPVEVPVEPPAVWHTSWEAWQTYLAEYCDRTIQVLPVRETLSRAERNKRVSKTKRGGNESRLVPEGLDPYSRVYICTHGWKKRKSRGTGSRPRQHIRPTDCPFRFVVQWNVPDCSYK
jgi:hypothetical protein